MSIPPKPMMHIAFPPISTKFITSPYFRKINNIHLSSPNLRFMASLTFFTFPYFDYDASMHHVLRVLDALASGLLGDSLRRKSKRPATEKYEAQRKR